MPAPTSERQWIDANVLRHHPPPEYAVLQSFPSLSRYASYSVLGAGEFGKVFAAVHAELGRIEAVKRIEILDPKVRKMALAEARSWRACRRTRTWSRCTTPRSTIARCT